MTNLLFQGGSFAIPFILSLYLQYVSDLDSRYASFILIIPQILMIVLGPVSSRLSDRWSSPLVAAIGCLLGMFGLLLVVGIGEGTSLVQMVLALLFIGAGTAFFMPAILSWALRKIPKENFGVASAFTETSRLAGMTLSNAVIIVIFSVYMGGSAVNEGNIPEFITSVQVIFAVFLLSPWDGMALALWGRKRRWLRVLSRSVMSRSHLVEGSDGGLDPPDVSVQAYFISSGYVLSYANFHY